MNDYLTLDKAGLLTQAHQCPSPNCDERPAASELELVIIHGISLPSGQFGGDAIEQLFTNTSTNPELADLRVSAHFLIRRNGELIQFVPCGKRAWHAGKSSWQGRNACNDFSIGIELEGTDNTEYERQQYVMLAKLLGCLISNYSTLRSIVGHSEIAPRRKTDPGEYFDWKLLDELLKSKLTRQ